MSVAENTLKKCGLARCKSLNTGPATVRAKLVPKQGPGATQRWSTMLMQTRRSQVRQKRGHAHCKDPESPQACPDITWCQRCAWFPTESLHPHTDLPKPTYTHFHFGIAFTFSGALYSLSLLSFCGLHIKVQNNLVNGKLAQGGLVGYKRKTAQPFTGIRP